MNKAKYLLVVAGLALSFCAISNAKEIRFTTLPEVVRTTVIHRFNIVPEKVVRVVEEPDSIYQVTVVTDSGDEVIYVSADGTIVEQPSTVVESTEGTGEVVVTFEEIENGGDRFEFVQDQGPDAIYIDHQTNKRVLVKGAAGKAPRGGVRTREQNQTDIRTNEKNQGEVRTNETNQQPGVREKSEQGTSTQREQNMRQEQRAPNQGMRSEQRDEGNQQAPGSGQQEKNRDMSGNPKTEEKNAGERNPNANQSLKEQRESNRTEQRETNRSPGEQQQQSQEKTKGKGKANPTP